MGYKPPSLIIDDLRVITDGSNFKLHLDIM